MKVRFEKSTACGTAAAPPSKSMAHRLLLGAGLTTGVCEIKNVPASEDIAATLECLKRLKEDSGFLPVRESASTMRFLIPVCWALGKHVVFSGEKRLFSRPLDIYEEIAERERFLFKKGQNTLETAGKMRPGTYSVRGDISSQFITGLLFALPLLEGDSRIEILPPLVSRPYIEMTMQALRMFHVETWWEDFTQTGALSAAGPRGALSAAGHAPQSPLVIRVPGRQTYQPCTAFVEGDWSQAAVLEAFNLAAESHGETAGKVTVTGLDPDSLQGDKACRVFFEQMKQGFSVIDLTDTPDLGPILFAAAALLHGGRFTGTARLQHKESHRVKAMQEELSKFGISTEDHGDVFVVLPGRLKKPTRMPDSHNDHRVAMASSVLLSVTGGTLTGAEAVNKSFPDFFELIASLGIKITISEK